MEILDLALEIEEEFGTIVTFEFKNTHVRLGDGSEQTLIQWRQPLLAFDLSKAFFTKSYQEYLLDFQFLTKGKEKGFLYRDPFDYRATKDIYNPGDFAPEIESTSTIGLCWPQHGDGVTTQFQLYKQYAVGTYILRPITRPKQDTIKVYINPFATDIFIEVTVTEVNQATGIVELASPPPTNHLITWEGEFYIPARFDSDEIATETIVYDSECEETYFKLPQLKLREIREDPIIISDLPNRLSAPDDELYIDLTYSTLVQPSYETLVTSLGSGWERRDRQWDEAVASWQLGGAGGGTLNFARKEYLIAFWRSLYGSGRTFKFSDFSAYKSTSQPLQARFDGQLSLKTLVDSPDDCEAAFALESATLVEVKQSSYSSVSRLCRCWKITRTDGVIIGATDHDTRIVIDGVTYLAKTAFSPTAYKKDNEATVDNGEIDSVIDSEAITEYDLISGKYDKAAIETFTIDWFDNSNKIVLFFGYLGGMKINSDRFGGRSFTLEVRSLTQKLQQKVTFVTTRLCRHQFGSTGFNACNRDLSDVTDTTSVIALGNNSNFNISTSRAVGFFDQGKVTFTSGLNAGVTRDVASFDGLTIFLWQPFPSEPAIGDTLIAVAGCAKTLDACVAYNNVLNFGGQPYVPGVDKILKGAKNIDGPDSGGK